MEIQGWARAAREARTRAAAGAAAGEDHGEEELPEAERKELHFFETEIVIGSILGVLLLATGIAVWVCIRRKRRRAAQQEPPDPPQDDSLFSARHNLNLIPLPAKAADARKRKVSAVLVSPALKLSSALSGGALSMPTVVVEAKLSPLETSPPSPPSAAGAPPSPWQPYLLGVPGMPTRARRRSVSLRGDSDSDPESPNPAGPEPRGPPGQGGDDEEPARRRSVTFNEVVEEVQILRA